MKNTSVIRIGLPLLLVAGIAPTLTAAPPDPSNSPRTRVTIAEGKWQLNGKVTYPGARAEGLLMNMRMVNSTFEDANDRTRPKDFDPDANTDKFIKQMGVSAPQPQPKLTLTKSGLPAQTQVVVLEYRR